MFISNYIWKSKSLKRDFLKLLFSHEIWAFKYQTFRKGQFFIFSQFYWYFDTSLLQTWAFNQEKPLWFVRSHVALSFDVWYEGLTYFFHTMTLIPKMPKFEISQGHSTYVLRESMWLINLFVFQFKTYTRWCRCYLDIVQSHDL